MEKRLSKVFCDIDNTVYPFDSLARRIWIELAHEKEDDALMRGAYMPWVEWRSPKDVCGQEIWEDVIARCHSDRHILNQVPYKNCVRTLRKLAKNHDIVFISDRRQGAESVTRKWLKQWGLPFQELICTHQKEIHWGTGDILIDDRPRALTDFVYSFSYQLRHSKPRKGFALLTDYNRNLTDIPYIYLSPNWFGLEKVMLEQELID
jgi:5'(3')-deoxyribonucleotidase